MKIINASLMQHFRESRRCELCLDQTFDGADPHHVPARGMGGGGRIDSRITLLACCRACHRAVHDGRIGISACLTAIAAREHVRTWDIVEVVSWLRRLDKDASRERIEEAMGELDSGEAKELARKTLREAGKL